MITTNICVYFYRMSIYKTLFLPPMSLENWTGYRFFVKITMQVALLQLRLIITHIWLKYYILSHFQLVYTNRSKKKFGNFWIFEIFWGKFLKTKKFSIVDFFQNFFLYWLQCFTLKIYFFSNDKLNTGLVDC